MPPDGVLVELGDGVTFYKGNLRLDLEHIGEGYSGEYNPDDPKDQPLYRFTFEEWRDGEWQGLPGNSYCTYLPVTEDKEVREKAARLLMDKMTEVYEADESIRAAGSILSWMDPTWITDGVPEEVEAHFRAFLGKR